MSPRVRASLAYFFLYGGIGALLPYTPLFYRERGLEYAQIGLIFGLSSLLGLATAPLWGALSDRFAGSPRVLVAAALAPIACLVLLPFATSAPSFAAANALFGIGVAGLLPIIDARAIETAGPEKAAYGQLRAWGSAGWVVFSLGTGVVIQELGIGAMFVIGIGGFVMTAILGVGLSPAIVRPSEVPLRSALRIFRARALVLFLGGMLLASTALAAMLNFYSLRFEELGASAGVIGLAWASSAAIEVPVMFLFPRLARRFGGPRVLVAGLLILALREALSAQAADPAILVLAGVFGGIGYAFFTVGGVAYVADHVPPELVATGQGIFQGVSMSLGQVVAAVAGGLLAGALGIAGMFAVAAAAGFASVLIVAAAVLPDAEREARPAATIPP